MARSLSEVTESIISTTSDHSNAEHLSTEHDDDTVQQILLLCPLCLLMGNIVRQFCLEFGIPFPYTVLLLLLGMLMGWIEGTDISLGLVGRAIDSIKHISPHLLLQAFVAPLGILCVSICFVCPFTTNPTSITIQSVFVRPFTTNDQ